MSGKEAFARFAQQLNASRARAGGGGGGGRGGIPGGASGLAGIGGAVALVAGGLLLNNAIFNGTSCCAGFSAQVLIPPCS